MVQTATGAIDAVGIPGSINGELLLRVFRCHLALSSRHKRTLINFQSHSATVRA